MTDVLRLGDRTVDLQRGVVARGGVETPLTAREAALLAYLADRAGRTVSRDELLVQVWGLPETSLSRTVDQAVRRVRTKIEARPVDPVHLITVHGTGYRLELEPESASTGSTSTGSASTGSASTGSASTGSASTESASIAPGGSAPGGSAPGGSAPGGSAPGGSAPERSAPGGSAPGGSAPSSVQTGSVQTAGPASAGPWLPSAVGGGDLAPTNLVADPSSFVGRQGELDALDRLDEVLVTVVGPAGAGKTRLARALAARRLQHAPPGGVWFVDASAARTLDDLCAAVARALELPLAGAADPVDRIGAALASRGPLLLVLDNLEQLLADVPRFLDPWRTRARAARFVATSRERLRLDGERVFPLLPLGEDDAVRLLLDRATAIRAGWGAEDPESVRAIARRLEGLPLALELAAARAAMLSPRELLDRLADRLGTLTVGRRGAAERQATLRGALDWSWELLGPAERDAFAWTSVFRGGFSLALVEQVVGAGALDRVQVLVDHSLIRPVPGPDGTRYALWEHVREYAEERLRAAGGWDEGVRRHRDAVLGWAEGLTAGGVDRLARLEAESDNLLAVAERARGRDPDATIRVALALDPLLYVRGPQGTHRQLLDDAIAAARPARPPDPVRPTATEPTPAGGGAASPWPLPERTAEPGCVASSVLAALLRARADARRQAADPAGAGADLEAALPLAAGDPAVEVRVRLSLCLHRLETGRIAEAEQVGREALAAAEQAGDQQAAGLALSFLGAAVESAGRPEEADAHLARAIEILRAVGDRPRLGNAIAFRGSIALSLGRSEEARTAFEEAIALNREVRSPRREAALWASLGNLHLAEGRSDEAEAAYHHARALQLGIGMAREAVTPAQNLAWVYLDRGDLDAAERALREAIDLCRRADAPRSEAIALGGLGVLELAAGRPAAAVPPLARASGWLDQLGDRRGAAYYRAWGGAAEALSGSVDAAGSTFAGLADADASIRPLVELLGSLVALGRGDRGPAEGTLGAVRAGPRPLVGRSVEVRLAARLVERALTRG